MPLRVPEEIFYKIIQDLDSPDLNQCQRVCKSWYNLVHIKFLNNITLCKQPDILAFIRSIDYNPDPSYLEAVKSITIRRIKCFPLSKKIIQQLFSRFPHLETVIAHDKSISLDEFDDEVCKTILKSCPRLSTFIVHTNDKAGLLNVRLLLTSINLNFGDRVERLLQFPRLQCILGNFGSISNFQQFLPIVEQLPNLKYMTMSEVENHVEGFAEQYLSRKTKDKQEILVKRLGQITQLDLSYEENTFCVNSINFIAKYLTGVRVLEVDFKCRNWSDLQYQLFFNSMLDYLFSVKETGIVYVESFSTLDLTRCLPSVVDKVFLESTPKRTLSLHVTQDSQQRMTSHCLSVETSLSERKIIIGIDGNGFNLFKDMSLYKNVDVLISDVYGDLFISMDAYDIVLKALPSLKEVILDFPVINQNLQNTATDMPILSMLEKVTLRLGKDSEYHSLLEKYHTMIPNMKQLNICCFSGTWIENQRKFLLELLEFSLESLSIDITPVITKCRLESEKSFVLDVNSDDRRLYKVLLPSLSMVPISPLDAMGYLQLHVTVNKLQRLVFCFIDDVATRISAAIRYYDERRHQLKRIIVFNK